MEFLSTQTDVVKRAALAFVVCAAAFANTQYANAQNWKGAQLSDLNDNDVVYLWNVGTQKFVGAGQRWGTQAVVTNVGLPFAVSSKSESTMLLKSQIEGEVESYDGYLTFMDGKVSKHDTATVFVDQYNATTSKLTLSLVSDTNSKYIYNVKVSGQSKAPYSRTYYLTSESGLLKGESTADGENSQWILVTQKEREEYFEQAEADNTTSVPGTFLIGDQDFARNHATTDWKVSPSNSYSENGALINCSSKGEKTPNDAYSTTSTNAYTYYVGNGLKDADVTYDPVAGVEVEKHNLQQEYGGDWTANIHGATGKVYQTITPLREGWYKISCVGFTNNTDGTAQLYAQVGDNTEEGKKYAVENIEVIGSDATPLTYVTASKLINNSSTYEKSVMVYVAKTDDGFESLTFGINVADANDKAWTCFDNFQLEYFGDPKQTLVLDETQTEVAYINKQRKGVETDGTATENDFTGQRTLYLNRTLNEGKWNTIVLPVNLTVSQVQSAFGDQVEVSEFKGATDETRPGTIIFEEVTAMRSNGTQTAIEANKLYLIKPSSTALYVKGETVSVPGTEQTIDTYYTIPQVAFNPGKDYESGRVEGTEGAETYGSTTTVKFVGTLVQLGTDNKIPGNSYVLNGNNQGGTAGVWYYRTKETASKGFRGWLETVSPSSKLVYDLNGVEETVDGSTTSIDNVIEESKTLSQRGAVYSLSGQLVRKDAASLEGLASGIYVVGGQKVIVK